MKTVTIRLGSEEVEVKLPEQTEVLSMSAPRPVSNPGRAVADALDNSIGSPGLDQVIAAKLAINPDAKAVIVISDNTRPVPYKGEGGILWPVVERLLKHGVTKERILVLVATGTHRALSDGELRQMIDPRVFEEGITIKNHHCKNGEELEYLGTTTRGTKIYINRDYVQSDIKILTGLVESHFMAGVSGGRKSVCPGLIGEESTYVFHGAQMLASPEARDLVLDGNPCHEEALEVAQRAGVDYIVNVTLDYDFNITGVFAGDLVKAHEKAVEAVKRSVGIPLSREYDVVVSHAGFVGINHYQAAKVGVAAVQALKRGGTLVVVANNTDTDPVGSPLYRTVLHLLKLMGPKKFVRLIQSDDWVFIPEQWQVQMWARLFSKIPFEHFVYYSPQLTERDYAVVPGVDGNKYLPAERRYKGSIGDAAQVVERAVEEALERHGGVGMEPRVAYMADGPYGIPIREIRS